MTVEKLLVETVEIAASGRQIGPYRRGTTPIEARRGELRAALLEIVNIAQDAANATAESPSWQVESLEATFGISVLSSGGVLIGAADGDGAISIKLALKRSS
ncbi:hypothetical protein O7635_36205 [Asanoa sp. WMMD1127]|uniref:hypothetical protein n=1 Tax=Asanoa sp. WMMD1127 TaxID=3016107 RepID=UPI00241696DB|nr:hypothetical protein [Asanoa sp. WMMD1127]MDG4827320.1 hypothetical protein [Asanoa sp. WMMD1127]